MTGFNYQEAKAQKKIREMLGELDIPELLTTLRNMAKRYTDGHYTILAFTSGFKVVFGTIDLDDNEVRNNFFHRVKSRDTLKDAVIDALIDKRGVDREFNRIVKIVNG